MTAREPAARLVGARAEEVVVMNSLTVNLHLLLVSFYRPTPRRYAIAIEDSAFPSDSYAVRSQAAFHGFDPDEAVIRLNPRPGEVTLGNDDLLRHLSEHGQRMALVLLGAVNYLTGERLDIDAITAAGHAVGASVGWDLAHAAGNVPLNLHDRPGRGTAAGRHRAAAPAAARARAGTAVPAAGHGPRRGAGGGQ